MHFLLYKEARDDIRRNRKAAKWEGENQGGTNPDHKNVAALGGTGGGKTLTEKALPVICITTTAGTGFEADKWGLSQTMKPMRRLASVKERRCFLMNEFNTIFEKGELNP